MMCGATKKKKKKEKKKPDISEMDSLVHHFYYISS